MRVEEQIFASGLPFTILQPAPYMQNILPYWQGMIEEGRYAVPYAPTTPLTHVDLTDVGEAAAIVLTEPGHEGAVYELCAADTLTPHEIAATVERYCARPIEVQTVPLEVWQAQAKRRGLGEYQVQALSRMFVYYQHHGLIGNERVLHCLLQRPPTSFAAFVQRLCAASPAHPPA